MIAVGERHRTAAFTHDGKWLVTDAPVKIWTVESGYPICDFQVPSVNLTYVFVSPDDHTAVLSGRGSNATLLDLTKLVAAPDEDADQAMLHSEIIASERLMNTDEVNLTNDEWLERWRRYRKTHPGFRLLDAH